MSPTPAGDRQSWPPWGIPSVLVGLVVGFVMAVTLGGAWIALTGDEMSLGTVVTSLMGLWVGYIGTAVVLSRTWGTGHPAADVGLSARWVDVPLGAAAGLVTSIGVVAAVYWGLVAVGVIDQVDLDRLAEPAKDLAEVASGPLSWTVLILLIGIGAPLVEEIFYRGLLQPALIKRLGPAGGITANALIFGAVHQQALQFPALAVFGAILGFLTWRVGRLGPAIAAHVTFNMLTLAQLALSG